MDLDVSLCKNNCRLWWKLVSIEEPTSCGCIVKSFPNALAFWNSLLSLTNLDTIAVIKRKDTWTTFWCKKKRKELQNRGGKRDILRERKTQMLRNSSLPGVARAESVSQRD